MKYIQLLPASLRFLLLALVFSCGISIRAEKGEDAARKTLELFRESEALLLAGREKEALACYRAGAELGDDFMMYRLAHAYHRGVGTAVDLERAEQLYRELLAKDSEYACCNLGLLYLTRDEAELALQAFRPGAEERDCMDCWYYMGRLYDTADAAEDQWPLARACYERATALGHATAPYFLAEYLQFFAAEPNSATALPYWQLAAQRLDPDAQLVLGLLYETGHGIERDLSLADYWYRQSVLGGNDDAPAYLARLQAICGNDGQYPYLDVNPLDRYTACRLAQAYANGERVKASPRKAFLHYRKAAALGDSYAMYQIGVCYLYGFGTVENLQKAVEFLEMAYEYGEMWAAVELGYIHAFDDRFPAEYERAVAYFEAASEESMPIALNSLAIMYDLGRYVKRDYRKAMQIYREASRLGNAKATYNIGCIYENGKGVKASPGKALKHYRRAAESGDPDGAWQAHQIYLEQENAAQAAQYLELAADLGHVTACLQLGRDRITTDPEAAVGWLSSVLTEAEESEERNEARLLLARHALLANPEEALQLCLDAAAEDSAEACYLLYIIYGTEDSAHSNPPLARLFLEEAARLGHKEARNEVRKARPPRSSGKSVPSAFPGRSRR